MLKYSYCFFLAAFLAIALPAVSQNNTNFFAGILKQKDNTPLLVINQTAKLIPKFINENNKNLNYTITVRYPQIIGNPLTSAAQHYNQQVATLINKQISEFKNQIKSRAANTNLPQATSYLKINYENAGAVSQSQHTEFQSSRFVMSSYIKGDAHPNNQVFSFNYDLGHDKLLKLADLFQPNSNYLVSIATYAMQQLTAKKLPPDFIKTGAAAQNNNYQIWNLDSSGKLVISFNEGQVAPRTYGPQEITIPANLIINLVTHQTACTLSMANCDGT